LWRPIGEQRPTAPTAPVAFATMVILRAKDGLRAEAVRVLLEAFATGYAGLVRADLSHDAADPERLMLFARWSNDLNGDELLRRVSAYATDAPERLALVSAAPTSHA
jgi:hypothetical protein